MARPDIQKSGVVLKYTLFGIVFGAMFPTFGIVFEYWRGENGDNYLAILRNNPLHYVVHLAPIVLGITFHVMGRQAQRMLTQLEQLIQAEENIRYNAYHDSLTGFKNRRAFTEKAADLLRELASHGHDTALILFDIDKFKFINDTLGHNIGDELIKHVVKRARAVLPMDVELYRLGGDEFVGLWPRPSTADEVLQAARALVDECSEPSVLSTATVSVGVSVGVSWLSEDDVGATQALGRADLALYHAKSDNGGSYAVFDVAMAESVAHRVRLQQELKQALSGEQLHLVYQPIMHVDGRTVAGFEALIRWQHPLRGLIMPNAFIEAAEQSGLIVAIGEHVLEAACEEALTWPEEISLSVNLSPVQFKDRNFFQTVSDVLERTRLRPERLILEMTESVFQIDAGTVREALMRHRGRGIRIALDDFGTGFSGINHLRHFPVDILKIDRQYTQAMVGGERERMLVQTISALAQALNLEMTFEGIETKEQLDLAAVMGASCIQGYYASPPLPVEAVFEFLQDHRQQCKLAVAS